VGLQIAILQHIKGFWQSCKKWIYGYSKGHEMDPKPNFVNHFPLAAAVKTERHKIDYFRKSYSKTATFGHDPWKKKMSAAACPR